MSKRGTLYSVLRCPARSHNGRWFEARQWAILGEPQALRAFCLWLEQGHRSWTSDAPARNIEISAKIPLQDLLGQCQHTDWIGLRLAMLDRPVALMGRMCSGPRVEATPLAYAKVPPLAHTAVSGLIFDGALFFGQPQASPPIPLWLERRSPHIPLGDLRSLLS